MAPKKDKQKEPVTNPSSQPSQPKPFRILQPSMNPVKTESPSQLVPFPGCSPIQVSNRFSSLGATVGQIRPNYQSALVASYDPFQIIPPVAQSSQSSTPLPKSSPYVPKDKSHLFIIEPIYDVKWWDKFQVARVAKYVYKDFPQVVNPPNPQLVSPVGSCSSLSIEGKSKSELQEIARQLIIQASQMNDDEDNDNSPASQSSSSCLPNPSPSKPHRCGVIMNIPKTLMLLMISILTKQ
ncbi:unnamed protein product [Prunus armeniaca]